MMQGGRGGGGVHAAVQRCQGDQKQAEQVKTPTRSGLSVFNQLSILYFLLSVLLQHRLSFVFLLSVYFCIYLGGEFMVWMRRKLWSWES